MFNGFTDRARRVAELAIEEAQALGHDHADPEHILLGIGAEGQGVAAAVLESMGVPLASVRCEVEAVVGRGTAPLPCPAQFSERADAVFGLSRAEAREHLIGTEHLLLGVISESGAAARILAGHGATLERTRAEIFAYPGRFGLRKPQEPHRPKSSAELDLESRISEVRTAKMAAISATDFEVAGLLREKEKDLLSELAALQRGVT
jgi:ATP-dependent Clp protease ATP-binding subunit ClpC